MATYCIADVHGCYDEFMNLIDLINYNPTHDVIYVLGDAIDRGSRPLDCLRFIHKTKGIHYILGNHDVMMLDYYKYGWRSGWHRNGNDNTLRQMNAFDATERDVLLAYVKSRPYYKIVKVGDRRYFLSHAGLDPVLPLSKQHPDALTWRRHEFYERKARNTHICIFGHTPTPYFQVGDCSVWADMDYYDKICIDCGCVFGGCLAALRLDDGQIFYTDSHSGLSDRFTLGLEPIPDEFWAHAPRIK